MREKLSDAFALKAGPGIYFDTDKRAPRGFLLRVTPAGARAWCLNYRVKDGTDTSRRLTIGFLASWPIASAREKAAELRREIDAGGDPLGRAEDRRAAPTVAELVDRFIAESLPSRAARTQAEYKAMLRDWIVPALGRLKFAAVSRTDIERLHREITKTGKTRRANAVKSLVSTIFAQAIVWDLRADNPAQHVKGNREDTHERFLSGEELDRLLAVLDRRREKRPDSCDAIMLAALTGARRGEILSMRWGDLDLEGAIWSKPATLTQQRKGHWLTLSPEAVEVLRRRHSERDAPGKIVKLKRDDAQHVFRGGGSKTHCNTLERDWREIRAEAGLTDVRFHDLRHSVASWLIAAGMSLPVVGSVLGHTKAATTQRYAHLSDEAQRQATSIVGTLVGGKRTK